MVDRWNVKVLLVISTRLSITSRVAVAVEVVPFEVISVPDLPNIKREILEYALEHIENSEDVTMDMYAFAEEHDYDPGRVAMKVNEVGSALTYGVSPMYPWPVSEEAVRERLDEVTDT